MFNNKILVIDDEAGVRKTVSNALKNTGHDLLFAENGKEGLKLLKEHQPPIIILDLKMPVMGGVEFLENINLSPSDPYSIIVLTGHGTDEDVEKCFDLGVSAFLGKPFNFFELSGLVRHSLSLKRKDDDLKKLNETLRSEIIERKRTEEKLHQAKDKAEEATKLKDKFVEMVSHNLKAPLANIVGFLNLICDDDANPLWPEHRKMVEITMTSANRLAKTIDELLDISELQTGRVTLKPLFIDGHAVVSNALKSLGYLAWEKQIEICNEVPKGTRLYADPYFFGEVLVNLVSNAIKFSYEGSSIFIFIPPNQKTTVAVKDTGAGIQDNLIPDLFKHNKVTTTTGTSGEEGTGLGIPFSQDIMERHGGTLRVESVEGVGSTFYARLPHIRPGILLIDDDKAARLNIMKILSKLDLNIVEVGSGEEAIKILKENIPNMIIFDFTTPIADGFEFLERLKKNPETELIPLILVTSDDMVETKEKAFRMVGNDLVTKPIEAEDLISKVKKFVV